MDLREHGLDIRIRYVPGTGWCFRVLAPKTEDWSGIANSRDEAWTKACSIAKRLGAEGLEGWTG